MTPEERTVVGCVALDPAYSGPAGLALRRYDEPRAAVQVSALKLCTGSAFRWLGDAVAAVCRAGERLEFVAECDAFGSLSVARKLGIGVGIVEGTLVDMQAVAPESRQDVTTSRWRTKLGRAAATRVAKLPKAARRQAWKGEAVDYCKRVYGLVLRPDAAEALVLLDWWQDHSAAARALDSGAAAN